MRGQLEREGTVKDKYNIYAPVYDLLSGEFAVYRAGRILGIDALDPRPGDQILDIGCGIGLYFPLLQDRFGPTGTSASTAAPECSARHSAAPRTTAGTTSSWSRPT